MNCPYCKEEIPEYSNLDFHVQTEHGFSVPAQYTQDTITRAMKDQDLDKIESFEYTQKQLEDAKHWWEKAKLPHETEKWNEMRIGDRQRVIGRYADYMFKKHVTSFERDLKPTGKNHGIDFYLKLAEQDYLNGTTHTPDEYENKLYCLEDTAIKRYGVPRDLPNGEEIVDSTYGTELHAKDWWDSKNIKNEKGDGKSRKWEDLDPSERKGIRQIFDDKVKGDYLQESFEQLAMLDSMPISSILTMMAQRILPDLEFLPNKIQQRVKKFAGSNEAVGLSRDWDEEEKGEIETKPTQLGYMWDDIYPDDTLWRDEDTGFYKITPSGGKPWQEGEESVDEDIKILKDIGICDKTLRELGYIIPLKKKIESSESWKCPKCGKEFGVAGNSGEGERFQHLMSHESLASEFDSQAWNYGLDVNEFLHGQSCKKCGNVGGLEYYKNVLGSEIQAECNSCEEKSYYELPDEMLPKNLVESKSSESEYAMGNYTDWFTPAYRSLDDEEILSHDMVMEEIPNTSQCDYCSAQFSSDEEERMINHINSVHNAGVDPITGDTNKSWGESKANEDDLDWTRDKPEGSIPFYCPLCHITIEENATWDGVFDHYKQIHNMNDENAEILAKGFTYSNSPPTSFESIAIEGGFGSIDEGLLDKIGNTLTVDKLEKQLDKLGLGYILSDRDPEQEEHEYATIIEALMASEGGFGSGKKGHVSWMSDMEYGGNYRVCPNCNVNTLFESKKCTLCGI
jgi:hypothetical protein